MATNIQRTSEAVAQARSETAGPRSRQRLSAGQTLLYAVLIGYGIFSLAPFVYGLLSSFKNEAEVLATPPTLFPNVWTLQHYQDIFGGAADLPFPRFLLNSLLYAGATAAPNVLLAALAGYAFGRMEFPGKNVLYDLTLAVLMIPGSLIVIPKFLVAYALHLTDNIAGLIVPGMVTPVAVILMTQFFKTLPRELEESAMVDGASRFRAFWQILLPLVRPAMITVALLQFQGAWNDFIWPLW